MYIYSITYKYYLIYNSIYVSISLLIHSIYQYKWSRTLQRKWYNLLVIIFI